jgi:hypothetical protein
MNEKSMNEKNVSGDVLLKRTSLDWISVYCTEDGTGSGTLLLVTVSTGTQPP